VKVELLGIRFIFGDTNFGVPKTITPYKVVGAVNAKKKKNQSVQLSA
jgi:hypothetical protein